MHGGHYAFFGLEGDKPHQRTLTKYTLVRHGGEVDGFTYVEAHTEMLLQVCRDYAGLPDPRTLKAHEIRFFYDALRDELKQATKPKG